MTAAAPWSVKGIDPKAREVAKDLARRAGMTLGEWLNRVILEDDVPEEVTSEDHFGARSYRGAFAARASIPNSQTLSAVPLSASQDPGQPGEPGRIATVLDRLTDRIEASETRTGLAISGVEHSVRHAMARIETAEREHMAVATRFDAAAERLEAEQARAAERLRRIESEPAGPRSAEAIRLLEARMAHAEVVGAADPEVLMAQVMARLGQRLGDAEARTGEALESLKGSLAALDRRIGAADGGASPDLQQRLEALADHLTQRVEDVRTELAERLAATGSDQVERRLSALADQLGAAEQRSAQAIETMGREVLAMAQALNRRVQSAEQRSAKAIEQVGGEIARIAGVVEHRLGRVDQLHAEALERLGAEIGRITERLTDRIMQSERRAAQAIDDVGEQVSKVTERIEQRHERAADDMAERLRQSEARMAHLLKTAQTNVGDVTLDPRPMTEDERDADFPASTAVFGPELFLRAEPATPPALDPGNPAFGAEDYEAADSFAPISEAPIFQALVAESPPIDRAVADAAGGPVPGLEGSSVRFDPAAPPAQGEPTPLSTREVIEQARATARAAAASPRPKSLQAPERGPRLARGGGFFGALKPGRPASTWQTALMVAGGAAFLSVGAAGVVLMEGPSAGPEASKAQIHQAEVHPAPLFGGAPRAALAMTPQSAPPARAVAAEHRPAQPIADAVAADYIATARAVEKKQPGAIAHLKALADAGHPPAQVFLARLYETGQAGVVQNLGEARRWTARAADAGDPSAMHNLALYYFRGEGGPQDTAAAAAWFKKAAQHGVVDSQYNLGLLYQSGSGVPRDLAQAYKWFSIAANGGDGEARNSAMELEAKLPAAQQASAEAQAVAFAPASAAPTPDNLAYGPSIVAAQKILGRLGYYKGRSDGATSRDLKLAVAAYQRDQGLAATGALDPATVSRLAVFTR